MFRLYLILCLVVAVSIPAAAQLPTTNNVVLTTAVNPSCPGGKMTVTWTVNDNRARASQYQIQFFASTATSMSNSLAVIYSVGIYTAYGTRNSMKADVNVPAELMAGTYKAAIVAEYSSTYTNFSNTFTIKAAPTMTIEGVSVEPYYGQAATIRLNFSGDGPWSFTYIDDKGVKEVKNTSTNPYTINPVFYLSTAFPEPYPSISYIENFSNGCATGVVKGNTYVSLKSIPVNAGNVNLTNSCPGNSLSVPFSTVVSPPYQLTYVAELSDENGSFNNPTVVGTGTQSPITAKTPDNLVAGTNYKVRINSTDYTVTPGTASNTFALTRPAPPTAQNYALCPDEKPGQLSATGDGLRWYSSDNTLLNGAPTPSPNVASTYFVTQTVNGCQSDKKRIEVSIKAKSSLPSVINRDFCQNEAAGQLVAQGQNIIWFDGNGQNLGSNAPTPSTNEVGTQTYWVSQDANGCRSDQATLTVRIKAIPAAPVITPPPAVCQYQISTAVGASAAGENLKWYDAEQGGTGNRQVPTRANSTSGVQTYFVSQTKEGCESLRAKVEQNVLGAPLAPTTALNPVLYCLNDTPKSLSALGLGLRWYSQETGGTFTADAPSPTTNQVSTMAYYVSQVGQNSCESQRLKIDVTVLAQPSAPGVTATSFLCQYAASAPLKASGSGLLWSGSGINGTSETTPTPPTASPATLIYQVVQRVGSCTSPASSLTLTVRPAPAIPTVESPLKLCRSTPARTLTAVGKNLRWYADSARSRLIGSGASINPTQSGVYRYYVTQTDDNTCESMSGLLEVRVSTQASARLTGDSVIVMGDSTAIRIRMTGDPPFSLTLWNGQSVTTSANPYVKWERPTPTNNTYQLRAIANDCGAGDPGAAYRLVVLTPLATEPVEDRLAVWLQAYPNPIADKLTVEWKASLHEPVTIELVSLKGQVVRDWQRLGNGRPQTDVINLADQANGIYILRLRGIFGEVRPIRLVKQ